MSDRDAKPPRLFWIVAAIVLAGGVAPLFLYWLLLGRVATVTPREAKALLRGQREAVLLVDVRTWEAFSTGHVDGAVNWPLEDILAATGPGQLPVEFRGRTLLLVCDVGTLSRSAARHLAAVGVDRAVHVRGGIQEWVRSAAEEIGRSLPPPTGPEVLTLTATAPQGGDFDRWRVAPDRLAEFPFRPSPLGEQVAAVLAFFIIKPVYTLLSLVLVVVLWRSRAPDLVALRWGMIAFFLGENACAVNYILFKETSYLFEYLHSYGMLVCFGFVTYAVLEGVDCRILKLSEPESRCAALGLCGRCIKYADVPCGLKRTFYVILPAMAVIALMLPAAGWRDTSYNTFIFGRLYNYAHLRVYQVFENQYCAAAAVVMFAVSLGVLALKRNNAVTTSKIFFAAGVGPLGFGMLRMVLGGAYDQNRVWYLFWEETTELVFILAVCFVLWIFRRGLLPEWFMQGETAPDAGRASSPPGRAALDVLPCVTARAGGGVPRQSS